MDVAVIGVFIPIVAIIGVVIMIVYLRRFENEERMSMIEKGVSPSEFKRERGNTSLPLRFALLLIGAGLGLFVGYFLDEYTRMQEVAYFSMLFVFGGMGLGLSYIIEERKQSE